MGLLFFSKNPDKFFDRAWIELVWHKDISGKNFKEVYFKGPLHKQLREVLAFITANIITQQVIKISNVAEPDRFFNFPFDAVEEVLSNAVYHKSYEIGSPIEVQVFPDSITILSHPGPVPPVNAKVLASHQRIIAREYRNRRVEDFLKELELTEGRGTGLPTIYGAMEGNGSPMPTFETDELNYFLVTLPINPNFTSATASTHVDTTQGNQASNQAHTQIKPLTINNIKDIIAFIIQDTTQVSNRVNIQANNQAEEKIAFQVRTIVEQEIHNRVEEILENTTNWINRKDLFNALNLSNQSLYLKKYLDPLLAIRWLMLEYPDKPTHPFQRYKITPAGERILILLKPKTMSK